jgi:type II secretory pathway pseudopilin PulG
LIELLIVVAIIAILAAIAVPNFLEAQVRSKVSRTRNDLRSIATALEAYAVDNRHYPPYGTLDPDIVFLTGTEAQILEPQWVTTPIAYLTSEAGMKDPFRNQPKPTSYTDREYYFRLYNYVNWDDIRYKDITFVHTLYGEWRMAGAGPDQWFYNGTFDGPDGYLFQVMVYDPTNGTVSLGDIFRTQKDSAPTKFQ